MLGQLVWLLSGVLSLWSFICHLMSQSFARLAWRKAARSLISNTQSLTISVNREGQRLWRTSPFWLVSDALWTNSWRYCSIMAARSDDSTVPSCWWKMEKLVEWFSSNQDLVQLKLVAVRIEWKNPQTQPGQAPSRVGAIGDTKSKQDFGQQTVCVRASNRNCCCWHG